MLMWIVIMWTTLAATGAALVYLSTRVCRFQSIQRLTKKSEKRKALVGGGIVFGSFGILCLLINFVNAIVCVVYFAMIWLVCDWVFYLIHKVRKKDFHYYYAGATAVVLTLAALCCGWWLDHTVWQTNYSFETTKNVKDLKIAFFADSHTGTTFHADGFAKHLDAVQAQNPDIVLVVGDFVDDGTTREDMIETCRRLGEMKTPYGVYFVFGNHDKGYYGPEYRGFSAQELIEELKKNNVTVLQDETVLVDHRFYIIGRKDFSEEKERLSTRLSMEELIKPLDKSKYMIVADHQPADYQNQAATGVDLVISGHTHGGQLFPFNQVGKWIGANDRVYGHEKRNHTDFVVTSGLSDWAIKFKTGTKSEFVVINVSQAD